MSVQEDHKEPFTEDPITPKPSDHDIPNGGYGWVCTVCCAVLMAHTWGINSSYGVFLAYFLSHHIFTATRLDYALVGSLSMAITLLVSPIATYSVRILGTRKTPLLGTLIESAALISASFSRRIWHLYLAQGVAFGIGAGLIFVASVTILPQWFSTRRSLASGISACGSGLGGLIYSLASQKLIDTVGLRWAYRILGIVAGTANLISSLLMRDRHAQTGTIHNIFDTSLLLKQEVWLLILYGWASLLAYVVLIYSLANYSMTVGLTPSQAALVSALFNLGQALGRPPIGYFSDSVGRINMAAAMSTLAALFALFIWIFAKTYAGIIAFAILEGAVAGTFWTTISPVTVEVVGLKHVASALNMEWIAIVLPSMASEPIALEMVRRTHSYLPAQVWTGGMYLLAAGSMVLLRGWKIGEGRGVLKNMGRWKMV
ncbi:MFS general substrate transporter [Piedraia hortae CBS 480.64]|uniref:MFS general substrate transporter n=1 Tax=Piedraia hortae CBS 480.64 TaxID=1314780 RepID=A0A6A7C557_9PEZI|nr:MFS general substrate transporter [Piedraia hortae CBS 480.64]